jgi:hypothetical protein
LYSILKILDMCVFMSGICVGNPVVPLRCRLVVLANGVVGCMSWALSNVGAHDYGSHGWS